MLIIIMNKQTISHRSEKLADSHVKCYGFKDDSNVQVSVRERVIKHFMW